MLEIIEGLFGNCPTHPIRYIKVPMEFWQNGPEELQIWDARSKFGKSDFFQILEKVAFYTN